MPCRRMIYDDILYAIVGIIFATLFSFSLASCRHTYFSLTAFVSFTQKFTNCEYKKMLQKEYTLDMREGIKKFVTWKLR